MFDIITIGTATRDVFLESPLFKPIKDPEHLSEKKGFPTGEAQCFALGSKIEVEKIVFTTGGGATNTAVTFSRQGLKTAAVIKVGQDEGGKAITKELKKEKVDPLAIEDKKQLTAYSVILLAVSGERTILVYRGASERLEEQEISWRKLSSRWVYLAPGGISFDLLQHLVSNFAKQKTKIAINPSKTQLSLGLKKLKPLLSEIDIVILNQEEASRLTGIPYQKDKLIFKFLDEEIGGILVVTEGGKGAKISDGRFVWQAGIFQEKVVIDRTGAGDAFGSGFVGGIIEKTKNQKLITNSLKPEVIDYAIRLGSANATSVIEHIGAKEGIITKKEFLGSGRWQPANLRITKHEL